MNTTNVKINLGSDHIKEPVDKLSEIKILNLTDEERDSVTKRLATGPKATRIIMTNHDTGEVLQELHNKVLCTGSMFTAMNVFNLNSIPVNIPTYNSELGLDHTLDYRTVSPKNRPYICLFCIGDSGCGTSPSDIFPVNYVDRIAPMNDLLPFRYVDTTNDLSNDLRKYYFGRKTISSAGKIAYYFKTFDSDPVMHVRYADGTQVTEDIYNVLSKQDIECYIETRLRINRLDFRDYFEKVRGWQNARISTLSLCSAWYDDTIDAYKWYQQIYPYSKLNFHFEWLVDLTKAIDFTYQVYY